jgi:hypothetical protein
VAVTVDVYPPMGITSGEASTVMVKDTPGVKVTIVVPHLAPAVAVTIAVSATFEDRVAATVPPVVVPVGGAMVPRLVAKVTTVPSGTGLAD